MALSSCVLESHIYSSKPTKLAFIFLKAQDELNVKFKLEV